MAVAESRPAVPAALYDVDEAAEALRLSSSVLYELIRSAIDSLAQFDDSYHESCVQESCALGEEAIED